jgi:uncharacterized coiled-coil protein SlyX
MSSPEESALNLSGSTNAMEKIIEALKNHQGEEASGRDDTRKAISVTMVARDTKGKDERQLLRMQSQIADLALTHVEKKDFDELKQKLKNEKAKRKSAEEEMRLLKKRLDEQDDKEKAMQVEINNLTDQNDNWRTLKKLQDEKINQQGTIISALKALVEKQEKQMPEQDKKIAEQEKQIAEQDKKIAEQEKRMAEQDNKIAEQDKKIAEQTVELSKVWERLDALKKERPE